MNWVDGSIRKNVAVHEDEDNTVFLVSAVNDFLKTMKNKTFKNFLLTMSVANTVLKDFVSNSR